MSKWLNSFQPTGALILRLVLGVCLFHFGYQKVVPHGALDATAHYDSTLRFFGNHVPYWLGYVSAFTEFVGGILIILGLCTRFAAAFIAINMLFALALVGIHNGPNMYFFQLSLFANATMLLFYGPGALALDRKIGFA